MERKWNKKKLASSVLAAMMVLMVIFLVALVGNAMAATIKLQAPGTENVADLYVDKSHPDHSIRAWTLDIASHPIYTRRSYIKFDISSIPNGVAITEAKIVLHNGGHGTSYPGRRSGDVSVHHVYSDVWGEDGSVTWNNQPNFNSIAEGSVFLDRDSNSWSWDVTNLIKNEYNANEKYISFVFKATQEGNYAPFIYAVAKDIYVYYTPEQRPLLVVTYPGNEAPIADAGVDQIVLIGDTVQFDGSGSSDSDGTIVSYSWDFDNSEGIQVDQTGISPTHVYNQEGTYIATLKVVDDDGLASIDTVTIYVLTQLPFPCTVKSSDASASEKNAFDLNEDVYCYGTDFPKNRNVKIYVVNNKDDWADGDSLSDVGDGVNIVTTSDVGEISNTEIWHHPLRVGKYDIVVDLSQDGYYNVSEDAIDSSCTVGFEAIPEFPTIAIPVVTVIGLIFLFSRRKQKG